MKWIQIGGYGGRASVRRVRDGYDVVIKIPFDNKETAVRGLEDIIVGRWVVKVAAKK